MGGSSQSASRSGKEDSIERRGTPRGNVEKSPIILYEFLSVGRGVSIKKENYRFGRQKIEKKIPGQP